MKTITLTAFNRPGYTRRVLHSIRAANPQGYKLIIQVDPGCDETLALCAGVSFMDSEWQRNPEVLGINWNNKAAYDRAFSSGSEFNVALEDDTPLCPDALELAEWFREHPNRDDYLLLNLFNEDPTPLSPRMVYTTHRFCPWGFCMTREAYESYIKPQWMTDDRGWDWTILTLLEKLDLKALVAGLSRCRNIGRSGGVNYTELDHDEKFSSHPYSRGGYGGTFRLGKQIHIPNQQSC